MTSVKRMGPPSHRMRMRTQLVFCWIGVILVTSVADVFATEVMLQVLGSHNESKIVLCPNDDFMLVFECTVFGSTSFFWQLNPLLSVPVTFSSLSQLGERRQDQVKFVLSKMVLAENTDKNVFISQVQLHTDVIKQTISGSEHFEVQCQAQEKLRFLTLSNAVGDAPSITSATIVTIMLLVSWSTNIPIIFNTAVITTSVDSGLESSVIVGRDERNVSLLVNPADDHHVRVIVFDHCRQNFTSKPFYVEGLPRVSTIQLSSSNYKCSSTESSVNVPSSVFSPNCTGEPQQCSANNGAAEAACAVLGLLSFILICALVFLFLFFKKNKCKELLNKEKAQITTDPGPQKISLEQTGTISSTNKLTTGL